MQQSGLWRTVFTVLLVVVVVASTAAVASADSGSIGGIHSSESSAEATAQIESVSFEHSAGTGVDTSYVWRNTPDGEAVDTYGVVVETTVERERTVCFNTGGPGSCIRIGPDADRVTADLQLDGGSPTDLTVSIQDPMSGEQIATESLTVLSISRAGDLDDDGLTNAEEHEADTRLSASDSDSDGIPDPRETDTDPTNADTDGDGITDGRELELGTDPTVRDSDGDGLLDATELALGTDPLATDTDGDGLTDDEERLAESSATTADTDGDGVDDGKERLAGTDPTVADTDGDGLTDGAEFAAGTAPTTADTDGDGLVDGAERVGGTDPTVADSDGDGLDDATERDLGTDPLAANTDGDLLGDRLETVVGTDPTETATLSDGGLYALLAMLLCVVLSGRSRTLIGRLRGVAVGRLPSLAARTRAFCHTVGVVLPRHAIARLLGSRRRLLLVVSALTDSLVRILAECTPTRSPDADSTTDGDDHTLPRDPDETRVSADVRSTADSAEAAVSAAAPELDDERLVVRMLSAEDGRLKQGEIVRHSDWSKAKVSRLLSRMADDGEVTKIRLGRENLICLAGHEPAITATRLDRADGQFDPTPG